MTRILITKPSDEPSFSDSNPISMANKSIYILRTTKSHEGILNAIRTLKETRAEISRIVDRKTMKS
jgi:hypothetical protein